MSVVNVVPSVTTSRSNFAPPPVPPVSLSIAIPSRCSIKDSCPTDPAGKYASSTAMRLPNEVEPKRRQDGHERAYTSFWGVLSLKRLPHETRYSCLSSLTSPSCDRKSGLHATCG